MKVSAKTEGFKPVEITLTFQTADELGVFYALFNQCGLGTFMRRYGLDNHAIRQAIDPLKGAAPHAKCLQELNTVVL